MQVYRETRNVRVLKGRDISFDKFKLPQVEDGSASGSGAGASASSLASPASGASAGGVVTLSGGAAGEEEKRPSNSGESPSPSKADGAAAAAPPPPPPLGGGANALLRPGVDGPSFEVSANGAVEEQTALFEDILHPEMMEAIEDLQQLEFEGDELVAQLKRQLKNPKKLNRDLVQALTMELDLRKTEKTRVMETLRQVERERNENMKTLIKEMRTLRKQNKELMGTLEARNARQEGNFALGQELDMYDWVVDINLLGDLAKEGWKVAFSEKFFKHMLESGAMESTLLGLEPDGDSVDWQGAVIAVVGLYDKGKTFVLNQITGGSLPSGKKCTTKGLSFKHVNVEQTNFVLLDSAGSYSPVKVVNELSVAQKEATELFLLDLIFELSDYFICVVNDFTSLDQRYLDKLTRSLQNSNKMFREVIVVHNLKEVTSAQVLAHVWETQVTQIYSGGQRMSTQVAAVNPSTGKLEEKHVEWFKTKYSRHICLANHDSFLGRNVNPWTVSLLRYWLKSVFVPVDRKFSVVNAVIHFSNKKLSTYFKDSIQLTLYPGPEERIKFIRPVQSDGRTAAAGQQQFRLPQVALDASGLMLTRPDSFVPPVDIIIENNRYTIYMDVPGLSAKDITLARQNVVTIIKGHRQMPYSNQHVTVEKQERKYGDFTMTYQVPQNFERRWESCHVENGVLKIQFRPDQDDSEHNLLVTAPPAAQRRKDDETRVKDPEFIYSPDSPTSAAASARQSAPKENGT